MKNVKFTANADKTDQSKYKVPFVVVLRSINREKTGADGGSQELFSGSEVMKLFPFSRSCLIEEKRNRFSCFIIEFFDIFGSQSAPVIRLRRGFRFGKFRLT